MGRRLDDDGVGGDSIEVVEGGIELGSVTDRVVRHFDLVPVCWLVEG